MTSVQKSISALLIIVLVLVLPYLLGRNAGLREDLAACVKDSADFRASVAQAREAQDTKNAAEVTRQENLNEKTHSAYRIVMDRIDAQRAAVRVRSSPPGAVRPGGDGVSEVPSPAGGTPPAAPQCGPDPEVEARLYNATKDAAQLELLIDWTEAVRKGTTHAD